MMRTPVYCKLSEEDRGPLSGEPSRNLRPSDKVAFDLGTGKVETFSKVVDIHISKRVTDSNVDKDGAAAANIIQPNEKH